MDETGDETIVDGHHRLAWAERDGAKRVPVKRLKAKNAAEAKKLGERLNRAAGTFSAASFSAASFSAAVPVPAGVSAEQVGRVVDQLLKELLA